MAALVDRTIDTLLAQHRELVNIAAGLNETGLAAQSGASEWTVAQVYSHLGSGAEIMSATVAPFIDGASAPPPPDFNQSVWDRWDTMSPRGQADGFVEYGGRLAETLDALTAEQRETVEITLPYLPAPVGVVTIAGMRLNEVVLHGWDIRAAKDPAAVLDDEVAAVVVDQLLGPLNFMLGFIGKADALSQPVVVDVAGHGLRIEDAVSFTDTVSGADARFEGPLEAFVRLIAGRLGPGYTPDDVRVSGAATLDDLRRVFPGL